MATKLKVADPSQLTDAWGEILEFQNEHPAEAIDGIVLGWWGGYADCQVDSDGNVLKDEDGNDLREAYQEDPGHVPFEKQLEVLSICEAEPFMHGWRWHKSSFGTAKCYFSTIWTTNFILSVVEYDGQTGLRCINRNPIGG